MKKFKITYSNPWLGERVLYYEDESLEAMTKRIEKCIAGANAFIPVLFGKPEKQGKLISVEEVTANGTNNV